MDAHSINVPQPADGFDALTLPYHVEFPLADGSDSPIAYYEVNLRPDLPVGEVIDDLVPRLSAMEGAVGLGYPPGEHPSTSIELYHAFSDQEERHLDQERSLQAQGVQEGDLLALRATDLIAGAKGVRP